MFFKKGSSSNSPITTTKELAPIQPKEDWIWIDAYKGTDKNMRGYNNFQFEIGKTFKAKGKISTCANGFHCSKRLHEVFQYYSWKGDPTNRYFKVKALVRKEEWESYDAYSWLSSSNKDKIVAKEIIFLEEITYSEELLKEIQNIFGIKLFVPDVDTLKSLREDALKDSAFYLYTHCQEIISDQLQSLGFSKTFSILLAEKFIKKGFSDAGHYLAYAKALCDEGISVDMRAYLLLK